MSDEALFLAAEAVVEGLHRPPSGFVYRVVPPWSALIELEPGEIIIGQVLGEKVLGGVVTEYRILVHEIDADHVGYIAAGRVRPLADNVAVFRGKR